MCCSHQPRTEFTATRSVSLYYCEIQIYWLELWWLSGVIILLAATCTMNATRINIAWREERAVYSRVIICPFTFLPNNTKIHVFSGKKMNGQIRTLLYFYLTYCVSNVVKAN